jgi:hypothetical protein
MFGSDGRGGLFAGAAAMAVTVIALAWFLFADRAPPAPRGVPPQPPPATRASPPPIAPAAPTDEVDLCGYGRVKQADVIRIQAQLRPAADKAFDRVKEKLAASKDARESALGLYLQGSTDTLAALATGSRDPQVYALAFLSCQTGGYASSTCGLLSNEQWADIEPDNVVPWLLLETGVSGPRRRGAIDRAFAAKYLDPHFPDLLGLMRSPDMRSLPPQTRAVIAEDLLSMQITLPTMPYDMLLRYCNFPGAADESRIAACDNMARVLIDNDRTILGLGIGIKLAQTANWPADAIDQLLKQKAEYEAARTAAVSQQARNAESSCVQQAAFERWAADYSRLGDRGVAMKYIQDTGSALAGPGGPH